MSDYIYGSSLRAAKSKANYLFEGDFRRRPDQNLSGASRSMARVELLQQAVEQRQNREDTRRREDASLRIQSLWRGYRYRKQASSIMRRKFDNIIKELAGHDKDRVEEINKLQFEKLCREFIMFYHSKEDQDRFDTLVDLMLSDRAILLDSKKSEPGLWLHRLTKLLKINLGFIERNDTRLDSKYVTFLEYYTRPGASLDERAATIVWSTLIECRAYNLLRHLVDVDERNNSTGEVDSRRDLLLELLRRSLDNEARHIAGVATKTAITCSFFNQFLHGPLSASVESFYLPELLRREPRQLMPNHILESFANSHKLIKNKLRLGSSARVFSPNINYGYDHNELQQCKDTIWLCYTFVRALHTRVDQFSDLEKVNYINIISIFMAPAEYITNISLMQAANDDCDDRNEELLDESTSAPKSVHQLTQYHTEIHHVITKLVGLINQLPHINSLKSIIFNCDLQPQVQGAIVQICNLMLAHEYLAIFNCRLLYTVAFSKEFSRSLWRSIITTTNTNVYGITTPIYVQISRASNISDESWKTILSKLRLFCSLCSYLLPTLDDEEFYTSEKDNLIYASADERANECNSSSLSSSTTTSNQAQSKYSNTTTSTNTGNNQHGQHQQLRDNLPSVGGGFYVDKELIGISSILRDICVGMIEILYHSSNKNTSYTKHQYQSGQALSRFDGGYQDEQSKLLSFEIKSCFQALVRLVCQLHARDSRKQFCPDGHWICPSVVIPANKAIDFQLVTSQQGRLLNQMTRTDEQKSTDRHTSVPSEIKTVLILQEIPFVISFHDRVQIFHQLLRKDRQVHQSEGYHFGLPGTAIQVQIRRNYIYEDAFEKLSFDNEPNMKLPLKVSLINEVGAMEAGIDGGGLSKEFLSELLKAGFYPMRGFFIHTRDNLLYPNPSAKVLFGTQPGGYEIHYEFLGRMLGKAIFEKIMVELPLASFFLAKLLAVKHSSDVDLHNLESLDPVLYKNLVYLKNYKGDVADLNLDFTISNNELDEHEVVELKPGGSKIPVTRENKIEYVHLVADYRLNKQIRLQCAAFKRGLAQLIDLDWLRMFDPRELQILISGAPTMIDVADWRRHTIYGNGYSNDCEPIQTFWQVISEFDENQKRKLLKFATSCSLPPLLGFKDLVPQFAIAPSEESRLPTASTCMNLLKLPECEDENTMRSKLLYAIESNAGFELS